MTRSPLTLLWFVATACGAPRTTLESHGVSVEAGPCGRGLVVVESDYQSSNVSLLDFAGKVLTPSLVSSSTQGMGFGVSLGSDAVPPGSPEPGPRLVLIDRYPAGVLRFVDLSSGQIASELAVGSGFRANPQDYLALSAHEAYVARYEVNPNPGRQAWDQGGDILLIEPSLPQITGRIDLTAAMVDEPSRFSAHPARLVEVNGRIFALLASYANDYAQGGTTSRLVEIDPTRHELSSTVLLDDLRGCTGLASSPTANELAIACSGDDLAGVPPNLAHSGLALVDISGEPRLKQRFSAASLSNEALSSVAYAASGVLAFGTLGYRLDSGAIGAEDGLFRLDVASGQVDEVLRSEGQPFSLGGMRCVLDCAVCFATDAERAGGSVLRFAVDPAGVLSAPEVVRAETRIGLPPRYLGEF